MKIEGSVQEIKELFKNFQLRDEKKTPVAGTTDATIKFDNKKLINYVCQNLANCDTTQEA